jgi:hypothetical protein
MSSNNAYKIAKYSKLLNNATSRSMAGQYRQKLRFYQGQSGGQWGGVSKDDPEVKAIQTSLNEIVDKMTQAKTANNFKGEDGIEGLIVKLDLEQKKIYAICKKGKKEEIDGILAKIKEIEQCKEPGFDDLFDLGALNTRLTDLAKGTVEQMEGSTVPVSSLQAGIEEQERREEAARKASEDNVVGTGNKMFGGYNNAETEDFGNWVNRLIN